MKKITSLSVWIILGLGAFAQDTIPKSNLNRTDTIPAYNKTDTGSSELKNRAKTDSNYAKKEPWYLDSLQEKSFTKNDTTRQKWNAASGSIDTQAAGAENKMDSSTSAKSSNTTAMASSVDTVKITDRLLMYNDSMYLIKNGDSTILEKPYTLESGTVVMIDGNVKFPSGKTVMLKNGQFLEIKPSVEAEKKIDTAPKSKSKKTQGKKTAKPKDK